MVKRKEFFLKKVNTRGEYWGNEKSGKVLIFSHGFGVKRDSRGMFIELAKLLEKSFLVVLFDYVDVNSDRSTTAYSFSEQAKKLQGVIEYVRKRFGPKEIDIVAHSQGCVVVGLVSPANISKIVFVAGPTSAPGPKMKDYFSQRKDTKINEKGMSRIKRSNGTITLVPSKYWKEASKVSPASMYQKLSEQSKVYFIRALQDQVVVGEDYSPLKENKKIEYIELNGNHDFEGKDRKPWLDKVNSILKSSAGSRPG
jgi:pimeloyl-ACP methyl ester carboxylesterase